jgi:DNA-directed RNA polymerase subunit beta'
LRTFHIGGTATRIIEQSEMTTKYAGTIQFSDTMEIASTKDEDGNKVNRCMVRNAKITVVDKKGKEINNYNVPYGSDVVVTDKEKINGGQVLFQWDPYTDLILARQTGKILCKDFIEGETYHIESVEGGKKQMVIVEAKDRNLSPHIDIVDKSDKVLAGGTILPVKASLVVRDGQKVQRGQTLVKIPKDIGKTRDITGGLPRVAELFEARKPKNPSVVSEIDGKVQFGDVKRGIRKIHVIGDDEVVKKYSIPYGKHIIVHEGDYITAGTELCEGSISPSDILNILGSGKVREYLVNEIQEVYRLQGVKINDKHIEVIVRQMMQKVNVIDPGDSIYMPGDRVNKGDFFEANRILLNMAVIVSPGDSEFEKDSLVDKKELREINKVIKEDGKTPAKSRKPKPPTFKPLLMGITQASLNTESFISAASFQETTRILTNAAVECKTDNLLGLKENIAVGKLIPAGTGTPGLLDIFVTDPDATVEEDPLTKAVS